MSNIENMEKFVKKAEPMFKYLEEPEAEKLKLSSLGIPYGDKFDSIMIRPMMNKETKLFANMDEKNYNEIFNTIFRNTIKSPSPSEFPVENYTIQDRSAFILHLRIRRGTGSYLYMQEIQCKNPECKYIINKKKKLKEIKTNYLSKEYTDPYKLKLDDHYSVDIRFLRNKDEIELDSYLENIENIKKQLQKYEYSVENETVIHMLRIAQAIDFIYEDDIKIKGMTLENKLKFLDLIGEDRLKEITKFYRDFEYGIDLNYSEVCPKCKTVNSSFLDIGPDFFLEL